MAVKRTYAAVAVVLTFAVILRLVGITSKWLSYDELFSLNVAYGSFSEVLIKTFRFDVHPPFYCIQLHFWLLAGTSDMWATLNSVAWSVVCVLSLFWIVSRIFDFKAALMSAALLAVAPAAVYYAQDVRMYSMLMTIVVWAWYWNWRFAEENEAPGWKTYAFIMIVEAAAIYSHAIGLLMLSGAYSFALTRMLRRQRYDLLRGWVALHAGIGLVTLPVAFFSLSKGVVHAAARPDLFETARFVLFGYLFTGEAVISGIAVALASGMAAIILMNPSARSVAWHMVLFPMLVILAVSLTIRPIWLNRSILFVLPFLFVSLALALTRSSVLAPLKLAGVRFAPACVAVLAAVLAAASIRQQTTLVRGNGAKPAAELVRVAMQSGDLVLFTGNEYHFFNFSWYFLGPDWGGPLQIHPINEKWRRVLDRLGPEWCARLRLNPTQTELASEGIVLRPTFSGKASVDPAQRVFLVIPPFFEADPPSAHRLLWRRQARDHVVELWLPEAQSF